MVFRRGFFKAPGFSTSFHVSDVMLLLLLQEGCSKSERMQLCLGKCQAERWQLRGFLCALCVRWLRSGIPCTVERSATPSRNSHVAQRAHGLGYCFRVTLKPLEIAQGPSRSRSSLWKLNKLWSKTGAPSVFPIVS